MQALNADQRTGSYNSKPSYTIQQAAQQLGREGLSWSSGLGQSVTVTYAFRASPPADMPEDTGGFSQFGYSQIVAAEKALAAWSAVAGITFVRVGSGESGSNAYSDDATILFGNYTSGQDGAAAFAYLPGSTAASSFAGDVWINSTLGESRNLWPGDDGFATLLHEIGHAIGLTHPSDYEATNNGPDITYARDAVYFEDSLQYTIMSYFSPSATGSDVDRQYTAPKTPLIDDIAAVQRLYGVNPQGNAGDTVYQSLGWGAVADASGVDTLSFLFTSDDQMIDLRAGNFSDVLRAHGNFAIALGTTIENATAGFGNDTIIGNDVGNVMDGQSGDDLLRGGLGHDTYIGNSGNDRAQVGGNVWDYRLVDGGSAGLMLISINGSGNSWIDPSTETIQFQNGQYLSLGDVRSYVQANPAGGYQSLVAPLLTATGRFSGSSAAERLFVAGNVDDYTLSRATTPSNGAEVGDFVLTHRNGVAIVVGEAVDQVVFHDGRYLSLRDLGAYVAGSNALSEGGAQDDVLFQTKAGGYSMFAGGAGNDIVYLNGNVSDYTVVNFTGASMPSGEERSGLALVARNGSGIQFIDASVEAVQFRDGQYLSYQHVRDYVTVSGSDMTGVRVVGDGLPSTPQFALTQSRDTLYLDGNAGEYLVLRGADGHFVFQRGSSSVAFDSHLDTVQFQNGQYLSVEDLPAYARIGVYQVGTSGDDLLWAAADGNQYLAGKDGTDHAYLPGNVGDYTLAEFTRDIQTFAPDSYRVEITQVFGYRLVARNGSGNIDIDPSTEVIHFQNGQYLSYQDLSAYILG